MTKLPKGVRRIAEATRWRELCQTATAEGFERLVHEVLGRARSSFAPTRPHGNLGDRKTDGFDEETGTIFQVYSPETITPATAERKIRQDLKGAVEFWGNTARRWTFVYNDRGIPTDIVASIIRGINEYPELELAWMMPHDLWVVLRDELTADDRNEVLGPLFPPDWDTPWLVPADGNVHAELLLKSHIPLVHSTLRSFDPDEILEALHPIPPVGTPVVMRPSVGDVGWEAAALAQQTEITRILDDAGDSLRRFAVFPLSEIPLLIHLGYVLSDTVPVKLFQYDRFRGGWRWPEGPPAEDLNPVQVKGLLEGQLQGPHEVVVRISLSAAIHREQTQSVTGDGHIEVDLGVPHPSREWLASEVQLDTLRRNLHRLFDQLLSRIPGCERIHLFYAGPAPGAVAVGQAINPRMAPPVQLYEYDRSGSPPYTPVLVLDGPRSLSDEHVPGRPTRPHNSPGVGPG
jgi:hypothetical protein